MHGMHCCAQSLQKHRLNCIYLRIRVGLHIYSKTKYNDELSQKAGEAFIIDYFNTV